MASTVQTGGGSGVDLSELTSGERLLIGLLFTPMSTTQSIYFDSLDFSKISSVTCHGNVYFYFYDKNNTVILYKLIHTEETLQVPSGTTKMGLVGNDMTVSIVSFTTTDGKVHAADNLNY